MNNYWLIGGGVALAALIVASVIAAILQEEAEFEPGSPEAVVQGYLSALEEEDLQAAYEFLSPELQEKCSVESMFSEMGSHWPRLEDERVTLEETRTLNDVAFVEIKFAGFRDVGLFGPSEYDFNASFALRQFNGEWKLSQDPWPHFSCTRNGPSPSNPRPID